MLGFSGYLGARLTGIGTKSEGPAYFLQMWDYAEVPIVKRVYPWENEAELHERLGTKVTISGDYDDEGIIYEKVGDYEGDPGKPEEGLELALMLEGIRNNVIWNHPPEAAKSGGPTLEQLVMTLRVRWPFRSIWKGTCPTTQVYDFAIYEGNGQGRKEIWRWSDGRPFAQIETLVTVRGGDFRDFAREVVHYPMGMLGEGVYTVEGVFVAAGLRVERVVEARIAVPA
jgi:hypothetical protein